MNTPDSTLLSNLIVEHIHDGIVLTDAEGRTVWVNPAFVRLSGYALEEMLGKRPGEILTRSSGSDDSRRAVIEAIEAKTHCRADVVAYSKTGRRYILEINLAPIQNEKGEVTHFVAVERNVTSERTLAQESIDFEAYRRALDQQAIVSVTDAKGRITYVNTKFCDISGFAPEELIGKTHRIVNSGTHDRGFFRDMWKKIRTGESWHGEVCNRNKNGEFYWVDTTVVPVRDPGGDISRFVSIHYDITERKQAENDLRRMAEIDPLTGLANRARFSFELEARVRAARSEAEGGTGLVVMFDLDHFKDLNDTLGHHSGDLLLKEVGRRLLNFGGRDAVVARLGGDEFAAILPLDGASEDGKGLITRLHRSMSEAVTLDDTLYLPSFSVGVTRYPDDSEVAEGLMINADIALYEVKRSGRNHWQFFNPLVREKLDYRSQLKAILSEAIERDSFEIALQPICEMATREHRGFEVLVRLNHEGEMIPPDHFVPLAEELGLVAKIGDAVMRQAFAVFREMLDGGLSPGKLAINMAAPQLKEPGYAEFVQDTLFEFGLAPEVLTVEITETALIGRSTATVAKTLRQLREIGVEIALDDFGTGFSSLSHLKDFQVNKIKIDKSFVQDLEEKEDDRVLVDGLIGPCPTARSCGGRRGRRDTVST